MLLSVIESHASGAGNKKAAHRGGVPGRLGFGDELRASGVLPPKAPWRLLPGCRIPSASGSLLMLDIVLPASSPGSRPLATYDGPMPARRPGNGPTEDCVLSDSRSLLFKFENLIMGRRFFHPPGDTGTRHGSRKAVLTLFCLTVWQGKSRATDVSGIDLGALDGL